MPTLNWIGKDKVINHHQEVPYKVLEPKYYYNNGVETPYAPPLEGLGEDSGGLIIHGDNLEALKSLLPQYEGKIKCIYIDPPYNTGDEKWIYNDNVNSPKIKKWLGKIVGAESDDLTRHDKWLCMMYPRIMLLHKLLADDGVIFISINFKYEHSHLKCLFNEIFGERNYIGDLTWESSTQPINSGSARFGLQQKVEPIIFFAKNKTNINGFILEEIESGLKYPHDGILGKCRFEIIEKSDAGGYQRDTMKFEILGQKPRSGKRWQIGQDTAIELERNNRLEIVDGFVKKAVYPDDELDKRKFIPFWSHFSAENVGSAQKGKDILNEVMGKAVGFDTVKPPRLIEELISHFPKNSIILDSFAGSGTTAHAVLNLNKQDGGNRKFILIEMEDYANTITAERVKRVICPPTPKGGAKEREPLPGSFTFYELGEPIFLENDLLNESIGIERINEYVWFSETKSPITPKGGTQEAYLLGVKEQTAYYFYYDTDVMTTLDESFLRKLKTKAEQYIIYADNCLLDEKLMSKYHIIFKKIPRDITRF